MQTAVPITTEPTMQTAVPVATEPTLQTTVPAATESTLQAAVPAATKITEEAAGRQLLVNGEPVFLMGFNRHEDYATVGCAIPLQLMVQDMDLMEAAGANAVRTCHYPNDERFLDLRDERGMLVWEENHARGFTQRKGSPTLSVKI